MTDPAQSSQPPANNSLTEKLLYRMGAATLGLITGLILASIYVGFGGYFISFGKIEGILLFGSLCGLAAGLFPKDVISGIITGISGPQRT